MDFKHIIKEFFEDSMDKLIEFTNEMKTKNNLEVGCGPCGFLNVCYCLDNRNIIDPLINGYKQYQIRKYGESWFDETINLYSQPCEILVPGLVGKIDGFIFCRNCLDHTQDWKIVLNNISLYAAKDSYFYFWSDIFHTYGTDAGHFNITSNKDEFRHHIESLGYKLEYEWEIPEAERKCINIGFIAKKL